MIREAIILCGGQGTRLQGVLPDGTPKCIAAVNDEPFIAHQLRQLHDADIKRVILATGYGADKIETQEGNVPEELVFSREEQPLGTGGALRLAAEKIQGDSFLVLNGDTYVDLALSTFVEWFDLVGPDVGVLLVKGDGQKRLGILEEGNGWMNGGVYAFKKDLFPNTADMPPHFKCELEEHLFPQFKATKKRIIGYQTSARWIDIGTPESLARAQEFFACLPGSTSCSPAGTAAGQA